MIEAIHNIQILFVPHNYNSLSFCESRSSTRSCLPVSHSDSKVSRLDTLGTVTGLGTCCGHAETEIRQVGKHQSGFQFSLRTDVCVLLIVVKVSDLVVGLGDLHKIQNSRNLATATATKSIAF